MSYLPEERPPSYHDDLHDDAWANYLPNFDDSGFAQGGDPAPLPSGGKQQAPGVGFSTPTPSAKNALPATNAKSNMPPITKKALTAAALVLAFAAAYGGAQWKDSKSVDSAQAVTQPAAAAQIDGGLSAEQLEDKCYDYAAPAHQPVGTVITDDGIEIQKSTEAVIFMRADAKITINPGVTVKQVLACGAGATVVAKPGSAIGTVGVFGAHASVQIEGKVENVAYVDWEGQYLIQRPANISREDQELLQVSPQ